MRAVGLIGNRLYPFNEAYANQAKTISRKYGLTGFTTSAAIWRPYKRVGNFHVVNSRFVGHSFPPLSHANGGVVYVALKTFESRFDRTLLFGGIESEFLKYGDRSKCIPIVSTIDDESLVNRFADRISPQLPNVVVQSKAVQSRLRSAGVSETKLKFTYPVVDTTTLHRTVPPETKESFRFLFASAPNTNKTGEDMFEAKGVPILIEAFRNHIDSYDSELVLLWRNHHTDRLYELLAEHSITDAVTVVNENVDIDKYFSDCHATVIPYRSSRRSPAYPLSALESLYCGRPIVSTDVVELPEVIESHGCGLSTSPSADRFGRALDAVRDQYERYQDSCPAVEDKLFSGETDLIAAATP